MERVAVLGACRTPFASAHGALTDLSAIDLGAASVSGLLKRTHLSADQVDEFIWGNVCSHVGVFNIAREIALKALSPRIAAVTVNQGCLSSARAISAAIDMCIGSPEKIVVAGGSESISNMPIQYPERLAKRLYTLSFSGSGIEKAKAAFNWRPGDYVPKPPEYAEPSTGLTLGQYSERTAKFFSIARSEQDRWAGRSRQRAAGAPASVDVEPIEMQGKKKTQITRDAPGDTETSFEKLATLPPTWDPFGTVSLGNTAMLADGACAFLLTSEDNARRLDVRPMGYIRGHAYAALPAEDEALVASAVAVPVLCLQAGVTIRDIDVFEISEVSGAQVLATLKALESKDFMDRHGQLLPGQSDIDEERVNTWGGALAYGQSPGASGARLMLHALRRLELTTGGLGLVAACSMSGIGAAILLEAVT